MTEPEEKLTGSLRISTQCKFIESIVGMANAKLAPVLQGRQLGGEAHMARTHLFKAIMKLVEFRIVP
jgi:hypothetical protein